MKISNNKGSALIVSLVMLTAVTFLAILSLQSSTTQIRMVTNMEIKEEVFLATARELNTKYSRYRDQSQGIDLLQAAIEASVSDDPLLVLDPDLNIGDGKISNVLSLLEYTDKTPPSLNFGLADGSSVGSLIRLPFRMSADVLDASKRYQSKQILGFNFFVFPSGRQ